jgi:hypothetical protein
MLKPTTADREPRDLVSALEGVQHVPIREEVIGSGPPPCLPVSMPRPSSNCPAIIRCRAAAFSASSSTSSCADPRCSIARNPRREDHTTCTAPNVVFTVRIYGTRPLYEPRLVRKFSFHELQSRRSAPRNTSYGQIVAQLRCCSATSAALQGPRRT